jgi:hypothetical protein
VRDPLGRLRRYIRGYVLLEGLAVLVIYLALWFWVGLLVDYGVFRAFTVDWVQELPRGFRAALLAILALGLLTLLVVTVFTRLFREFRDAALALVLERRFPALLGDRLITAVELADTRRAADYGYSPVLLKETIHEAAQRVDQLSVRDAFDWDRLRRRGAAAIVLTAGCFLLAAIAFCAYERAGVGTFLSHFGDVAGIWFERNILLADTIWPRQAHLELLNEQFQTGDELKIGRDSPPTVLRVRALKWVIADSDRRRAPEGWRALRWDDLSSEMLDAPFREDVIPAEWREWTVDRIEQQLERPDVRGAAPADAVAAVRDVLARLHERAASSSMSRRLRELEIPQEVTVQYTGPTTHSEQTMQRQVANEYSGPADVKESVRFTIRGRDYYTPSKWITVVPPPAIVELTLAEAQPAYLYHRVPPDGSSTDLRGMMQKFNERPVSLTAETSRIDVPAGTDLVLTARVDKALRTPGGVRLSPPRKGAPEVAAVVEQPDEHTFRTRLPRVHAAVEFIYEFTDSDGVGGTRHISIRPIEDLPPELDAQVEVIRRTSEGYMVTPVARIPFSGKVRDDRGLADVHYEYSVARVESPAAAGSRAAVVATVVTASAAAPALALALVPVLEPAPARAEAAEDDKTVRTAALSSFQGVVRDQARKALPLARLKAALDEPPTEEPLVKEFALEPEVEFFAVEPLGLKSADEKTVQPRYKLRLWLSATDNDVETGPHTALAKEKFTILVVGENELLAEIAKEEEGLHIKLEEALNRLKEGKVKLDKAAQDLPELKADELSTLARRAEEVGEAVARSWDACREVYGDYRRILLELRANRVQPGMIAKVNDKICEPLDGAINVEFVQCDESLRELARRLDAKSADPQAMALPREQLTRLIARLQGVLDAMADVTTINRIIEMLVKIEKGEQEEYQRLQKLLKQKQEEILEGISGSEPKPK